MFDLAETDKKVPTRGEKTFLLLRTLNAVFERLLKNDLVPWSSVLSCIRLYVYCLRLFLCDISVVYIFVHVYRSVCVASVWVPCILFSWLQIFLNVRNCQLILSGIFISETAFQNLLQKTPAIETQSVNQYSNYMGVGTTLNKKNCVCLYHFCRSFICTILMPTNCNNTSFKNDAVFVQSVFECHT